MIPDNVSPSVFDFCIIKTICDFEHIVGSITFTGMLFRNHRVKFSVGGKKNSRGTID